MAETIDVLLKKIGEQIGRQIGLVWNFKNDLKKLQKTIILVKAFLHDAEKKQVTSHAVKIWLRNLEALAFEADNVFDEVDYWLLSQKVGATRIKTVIEKLLSCFPCFYRLKLGLVIKHINEKLESIHQQASALGLQSIVAQAPAYASASRQTDSFSKDPIFVGREEEVSSIVGTLITTQRELSVLPIVGMGGIGKTTLVRKVFNHEQIKSHFGDKQRVWVHVPRIFDEVVLLERILTSMKPECLVHHGNREAILKMLQEQLGDKKYLLVLDDVWNEDKEKLDEFEKWDDFKRSFSGINYATGNCMIVTTRSEGVASIVGTLPVQKLKGLSIDDCWSIIKAKAFSEGDDTLEFEARGKNVAEKCRGSPLAAHVVGGLLVDKSKDEWMSIEKNWLSDLGDENSITKILKLSFDNLSFPSLKKCFAYCSIFPKGYDIKKEQLVELWMAEGFLQTLDGNRVFNLLLQSSLLQVQERNVIYCNMHDHVHDLAYSILCENDNMTDGVCQRRYIGYKSSGDGLLSIPEGQERYVRTLFFDGKISDIKFSDFESLRTLTLLSDEDIDVLPISISELKHLRHLDISRIRIKYLPDSICELHHLQTLRAELPYIRTHRSYHGLKKLPNSLSCLISLKHLHIPAETSLPPDIGKLTSLQALSYFHVGSEKGYWISELGNLKNLKGNLAICNLENVRGKDEAMSADLHGKAGIYGLKLKWSENRGGDGANGESVLEGLQPHPNLKKLEICGFKGKTLALWEGINNLVEIKLMRCSELECLPDWLFSNNHNLTNFYIEDCPKITNLVPRGGGAPSFLRKLEIQDCRSLKELPDNLHRLNSLEVLMIIRCPEVKSIPYPISSGGGGQQQGFTSLRELWILDCYKLTNLPIEMVESCVKSLEALVLIGLRSITNLGMVIGCLHRMTRLRYLVISEVPKFSSKDIIGWEELEMGPFPDSSWDNVSFNEAVGAMLPQSLRFQISFNTSLLSSG